MTDGQMSVQVIVDYIAHDGTRRNPAYFKPLEKEFSEVPHPGDLIALMGKDIEIMGVSASPSGETFISMSDQTGRALLIQGEVLTRRWSTHGVDLICKPYPSQTPIENTEEAMEIMETLIKLGFQSAHEPHD
ncbi:hypothetical protein LWF15_27935 [Kineosporia rhizophila]|uniref:hypothetical protein n=1 Tax=Kineosporia TaxID=49184 RepID=UPI001E307272|nr:MULTISPECIES: hypothetical protein [Kineosporia]MCE0539335.1 hypothetical protein [Kineosporia rhizophila]